MDPLFTASNRYDRQVRLWGEEGQASIGLTTVCMIGSDSLATEILKSLVLAGIHSVHIIDDVFAETADSGQNFFLDVDDIGKNRAEATLEKLKELNPAVAGSFSLINLLTSSENENLTRFSVVVAANQTEDLEITLAKQLYNAGVPFVSVKTYGLLGSIKHCIKEHTIANSHDENPKPDLRLDAPFENLLEMVRETNLENMTVEQLRHTPYILLYFKALDVFRSSHNNPKAFPENYSERKEIQRILKDFRQSKEGTGIRDSENFDEAKAAVNRTFQKTAIDASVKSIFEDEQCFVSTQPFWLICEALRRFVAYSEGLNYANEMISIVTKIRQLGRSEETGKVNTIIWMLLMRAVARFKKEKGRFPGTNGVPVSIDAQDLKKRVEVLIKDALENDQDDVSKILNRVPDAAITEMCRFGAAELHVISSYIGGIAAQEIIKLATNQYVPLNNTFLFDGHTQESSTFML
ncbi:unnamed protein product [Caenorhabditis sp. 36 PRJEB53466]|nr:unnamed protein product [Caenorhabditis sp. 36 PRJEB53466]